MTHPVTPHLWDTPTALPRVQPKAGRKSVVRRRARRKPVTLAAVEGVVLCLILGLLLVLAGTAIAEYVTRPSHPPVMSVTVEPGDTLWSLASTYGAQNDYILRRVDRLAAYNHIAAGERLKPGQVLLVPVENPAMLTK